MSSSKVWLITGANSGLGLAIAQSVLSKGDKVIAAARDAAKIPPSLSGAKAYTLDPSAPEADIKHAAKEALKIYGRIDVLVNNAGYGQPGVVEDLRSEDIHAQFQTNVFGPIAIIQALLPSFRAQGYGHILNISSIAGFVSWASVGAYSSSKAALDSFSETLAQEVAPFGVRVHIISPGFFPTNFLAVVKANQGPQDTNGAYTMPEQGEGVVSSRIASRRVGDPMKLGERLYEIVYGTGIAQGLMDNKDWVRVPLGPDSGASMREKVAAISASVEAYEPIWNSTDMDDARLKEQFGI
ncbi:NAD-P-binding protein [Lactifluus volemus]|nr:NAD-P-binding protein [Lactifluus volemus]